MATSKQCRSGGCAPTAGSEVHPGDGYRLLIAGELLKKHDEGLRESDGRWHEVAWAFLTCEYVPGIMTPITHGLNGYCSFVCAVESKAPKYPKP